MEKYIHPLDRERVLEAIQQAILSKSTFQLEHRVFQVDGTLGWVFSRATPLLDEQGQITEWFGAATDVTVQRRSELALRDSEARYRSLFESIDAGFCVIEMVHDSAGVAVDYRFLEVNPAFVSQTGMQGVITGRSMRDFVTEIDPTWLENYDRVSRTGQPLRFSAEFKALDSWFEVYAFRIEPEDTIHGRVAVLFNNITERQRSEDALRASEERARAASAAKDAFLAQLSHELRTPLTPVLMTAAALRDDPGLSVQAREGFALVERYVALEARLIDDLLDLTRVTSGKFALKQEDCDVHSVLRQAIAIVQDHAREKRIAIAISFDARHTFLSGDPARLQQVFWNILQNAVKYTGQGGHIQVATRDAEATGGICIEVSDDGRGFDPAEAENLFQSFHQSGTPVGSGLGLGLAIARAIVDMHSGAISARSEGADRGATFRVTLPAEAPTASPASPPDAATDGEHPSSLPSLRILLVEDHEATLQVLSRFLGQTGHAVTVARSLKEARDAAATRQFDVVVSDLGLPDGMGTELMESLRREHGLTGVALSGYGMEEDIRRSRQAGFAAHLVKPVKFDELQRVLKNLCGAPSAFQGQGAQSGSGL